MFGRLTPVAKTILLFNVVMFLISSFLNVSLSDTFGLRPILSSNFEIYQFITYMWLHAGFMHLLGNMIAVLVFAPLLESVWGSKRFLQFYLICGIGAGLIYAAVDFYEKLPLENDTLAYLENPTPEAFESYIVTHRNPYYGKASLSNFLDHYYENTKDHAVIGESIKYVNDTYDLFITHGNMIGASGAVFGILFAFAFLFPNTELFLLFPPIPIKAKYLVFFYGMYELYSEFNRTEGDNVAHLAHLSGMLIAFFLLKFWQKNNKRFY